MIADKTPTITVLFLKELVVSIITCDHASPVHVSPPVESDAVNRFCDDPHLRCQAIPLPVVHSFAIAVVISFVVAWVYLF